MILTVTAISLITISIGLSIMLESREWNGGVCKESGKPWKLFDHDSQGGRGYTDGDGNYTWVSWPVDSYRGGGG